MATKKRPKKARAVRQPKAAGRKRSAKSVGRKSTGAKRVASAKKKVAVRAAAKPAARSAGGNVTELKARFAREKSQLEKRLTDSVREIGQLRHHEARVAQLERQLKERDETIGQLRSQLS